MKSTMKIIVVKPEHKPEVIEIDHTLEAMQSVVGGYIEATYPFDDEVALICNEEGKLSGLKPNCVMVNGEGDFVDIIFGTFFLCGAPADSENFESLTDSQIEQYLEHFW